MTPSATLALLHQTEWLLEQIDQLIDEAGAEGELRAELEALKHFRSFYRSQGQDFSADERFTIATREAEWCLYLLDKLRARERNVGRRTA